jgi:PAS domain S-box-containing protein
MLGWRESELLGQDVRDTVHPPHVNGSYFTGADGLLAAVIEDRTTVRHEQEVFTTKDGRPLTVAYTAAPLVTDGEVGGAVLSFREVTRRELPAPEAPEHEELPVEASPEPVAAQGSVAPAKPSLLVQEPADWLSYN